MRWEHGDMRAVLPVHSPCSDPLLANQNAKLAIRKCEKGFFFCLIRILSADLYCVWDKILKQITFWIQMAPDKSRLLRMGHERRDFLAALCDRSSPFLALLGKPDRSEEHT